MTEQEREFNHNAVAPDVKRILDIVSAMNAGERRSPEGGIPAGKDDAQAALVQLGYTGAYAQAAVTWATIEGNRRLNARLEAQFSKPDE